MALFGPKKLGLVLESGAARGLAHIGVLKALDEAGIVPDVITGTSMGAVLGAFYASGYSAAEIEQIALGFDARTILGLADVAVGKGGMLNGDRAESFLREHLPSSFDDLRIPFGCVATDLGRGAAVRFTSGDLVQALRASFSVPLIFMPVRTEEALYVDGFISDPLPVSFARALGAEVVAAVSVAGTGLVPLADQQTREPGVLKALHAALRGDRPYQRGSSSLDIMSATFEIVERELSEQSRRRAHVLVQPDVSDIAGFEFRATHRAVAAGVVAGRAAVPDIHRKIKRPV